MRGDRYRRNSSPIYSLPTTPLRISGPPPKWVAGYVGIVKRGNVSIPTCTDLPAARRSFYHQQAWHLCLDGTFCIWGCSLKTSLSLCLPPSPFPLTCMPLCPHCMPLSIIKNWRTDTAGRSISSHYQTPMPDENACLFPMERKERRRKEEGEAMTTQMANQCAGSLFAAATYALCPVPCTHACFLPFCLPVLFPSLACL